MTDWNIPQLDPRMLATVIPTMTYGGGAIRDPASTLFLWRSVATERASGGMLCFYVDDHRLETLWRTPERYAEQFVRYGIRAVVEVDFSLWRDDPVVIQLYNTYRSRWLGRYWQENGLAVIPSLSWSDERSFEFCFTGIPEGAPVVATECRTAGGHDEDRRRFLVGLTEGVRRVQPATVCIYGGHEHAFWLTGHLPSGPQYTLLESFMTVRSRIRAAHERRERDRNQLELFSQGGIALWAVEAQAAA